MEDADFDRVALYDPSYQTGWVHDPAGIARLLARRHGFVVLGAARAAAWMRAAAARGASSTVCVCLQGFAVDAIAESKGPSCTARRYLDAGGRLVWVGDVPFFQVATAGGGRKTWGDEGHAAVLGVTHVWGGRGEAIVTPQGAQWGLLLQDSAERCARLEEVTPLRVIRAGPEDEGVAATWHKAYHPAHPLQGFLRYRGGTFDAANWNAKVNELARAALRGFEDAFLAPEGWRHPPSEEAARAVFSDARYPAAGCAAAEALAARLEDGYGFRRLDAEALRAWMRAQVAGGAAGSVCVIAHGVAPDTVFDEVSPLCLARRYMDAGGRLVWLGATPFYFRGRPDGGKDFHGDEGTGEAVLDVSPSAPGLPDAGAAGGFAASWRLEYDRASPGSGFLRLGGPEPGEADAARVAAAAVEGLPGRVRRDGPVAAPEGTRAGAGSFVVDRGRALAKLMKFMLPAPELFVLPLARAAALSGADRLTLEAEGRDLVVRFGGRPVPSGAVADPFAGVIGEAEDPRLRAWGLAALAALRAGAVRLSSGGAGARMEGPEAVTAAGPEGEGTVFRVERPSRLMPKAPALRALLARRAPRYASSLAPAAARCAAPAWTAFDDGAVSGRLEVPREPAVTSNLMVCVHGVAAATVPFDVDGAAPVGGWVNDDRLRLNASINGVVRDERLGAVRGALAGPLARLVRVAAERLADLAKGRRARLARPGAKELWAALLGARAAGLFAPLRRGAGRAALPDSVERELEDEAALLLWLRETALLLRVSGDGAPADRAAAAVAEAALFTAPDGSGLSLKTLAAARSRCGRVAFQREGGAAFIVGVPTVWAPGPAEEGALRRQFGDAVTKVEAPDRRVGRRRGGLLERAGFGDVLARVPIEGGEAGLVAAPEGGGVRVRGLSGGRVTSFHHAPGPFALAAAVEGPADAAAAARAADCADRLHRALANSFSCPVSFSLGGRLAAAWRSWRAGPARSEQAALEHLRAYLASAPAGAVWPRSLPLFDSSAGWLSAEALARRLEEDGVLLWGEREQFPGAAGLELPFVWGRREADAWVPRLFPGLTRVELRPSGALAFLRAGPAPDDAWLAGEGAGAGATRAGYEAAVALAVRDPERFLPRGPWRGFVLGAARHWLAPWPGRPGTGALRALLFGRLTFQHRWGRVGLETLKRTAAGPSAVAVTGPAGAPGTADYWLDEDELSLLRALWPPGADRLLTVEEHARYRKSVAAQEEGGGGVDFARARLAARPAGAEPRSAATLPDLVKAVAQACGSHIAAAEFAVTGMRPLGGKVLVGETSKGFLVDAAHRSVATVYDGGLPERVRLAYLASCVHTAVNRRKNAVTDADDTRFQEALAAWAADELSP